MTQLRINNRKLSIADKSNTNNIDNKSKTWFWNESANETDLNTKEKRNSNHENDLESNKSKTEEAVNSKIHKVEVK